MISRTIRGLLGGASPARSVTFVAALAFAASAAFGYFLGIPPPESHDEFSYLLAADTFARGRVTNPPHPMWEHFETMHVIHQPTYMSKYMPAQGIFLMLGQLFAGHPIVGVWLSFSFMCGAICWMLRAWLPPRWALLGGLLAVIHPNIGMGNYFAQSYWGGAVAAAGGALLLGGIRRLTECPRARYTITAAFGLTLLANSRPYEGLVLSLPVGALLLFWVIQNRALGWRVMMRRIVAPLLLVGVLTLGAMGYYNYRITGDATQIPYLLHKKNYMMSSLFIWQELPPRPVFRHKIIEDFHEKFELPYYLEKHSLAGFVSVNFWALMRHWVVFASVFAIPLIVSAAAMIAWSWRDSWGRFALATYGFFIVGIMLETYSLPHYWAPVTALSYFFIVMGIRLSRLRGRMVGRLMTVGVPVLSILFLAMSTYSSVVRHDDFAPARQRARLLAQLRKSKEPHLIFVRYGPQHSTLREWVYNEADIDRAKVVWARDMGLAKNCQLADYYPDRQLLSLQINDDHAPIKVQSLPRGSCS